VRQQLYVLYDTVRQWLNDPNNAVHSTLSPRLIMSHILATDVSIFGLASWVFFPVISDLGRYRPVQVAEL